MPFYHFVFLDLACTFKSKKLSQVEEETMKSESDQNMDSAKKREGAAPFMSLCFVINMMHDYYCLVESMEATLGPLGEILMKSPVCIIINRFYYHNIIIIIVITTILTITSKCISSQP